MIGGGKINKNNKKHRNSSPYNRVSDTHMRCPKPKPFSIINDNYVINVYLEYINKLKNNEKITARLFAYLYNKFNIIHDVDVNDKKTELNEILDKEINDVSNTSDKIYNFIIF